MSNWTQLLKCWSNGQNSKDSYFSSLPKDVNDLVEKYIVDDLIFTQRDNGLLQVDSFINGTPCYSIPNARRCYTAYKNTIVTQTKLRRLVKINLLNRTEEEFPRINPDTEIEHANDIQVTPVHKGWLVYYNNLTDGEFYYFRDTDYHGDIQKSPHKLRVWSYNQLSLDRSNDDNRHQVSFFKIARYRNFLNIYDLNEDRLSYILEMGFNNCTSLVMYSTNIYYHLNGIIECLDLRSNISRQLDTANSIIPYKDSIILLSNPNLIDQSANHNKPSVYKRMGIHPHLRFIHSLSSI